jgi:CubicO group peptidase (beta-lactamase class C family)
MANTFKFLLVCAILLLMSRNSKTTSNINAQSNSVSQKDYFIELDNKIPTWLDEFIVLGTAIALIEDGEIILLKGYGYADKKT